jgi:Secretion system C-terminal sorting domain
MKTRLFFILASAAILCTSSLNASNFQKMEFKSVVNIAAEMSADDNENFTYLGETTVKVTAESQVIHVNLGVVKNDEISIRIEDANGNELISEKVKGSQNFTKKYNVSKLEDGNYTMIIAKQTLRTVQPFKIVDNKVTVLATEKKEKFLPVLSQESDKLNVNVLLGNYSNITVTLYDNEGRKVFDEKNYVVLNLHKRYDLSKLSQGVYVAEVMAGDETFYFTVTK